MHKMNLDEFLQFCEDFYNEVNDEGVGKEEAYRMMNSVYNSDGLYGVADYRKQFGLTTLDDLYQYGGKLAGEIEAFDADDILEG